MRLQLARSMVAALGHKPTSRDVQHMSALPPKADKRRCGWIVRFVPKAVIAISTGTVPQSRAIESIGRGHQQWNCLVRVTSMP
jgi:hypothetical protein